MLNDTRVRFEKEEELELGRAVQAGKKALERLENEDLTDEEIVELNRLVSIGEDARNQLFEAHIGYANRLAVNMYNKAGQSYTLSDMTQDAYEGLLKAIDDYDPEKNCKLSTHAFYKTTKNLSIELNKMRSVRLPENKMGDYLQITKAEEKFRKLNGTDGKNNEMLNFVMKETKLSEDDIRLIKEAIKGSISMNAPLGEDGGEFGDLLKDDVATSQMELNPFIVDLLKNLNEYERNIVCYEYNVSNPSMSISAFMKKYGLDDKELKKETKKVMKKIRKEVHKEGSFLNTYVK